MNKWIVGGIIVLILLGIGIYSIPKPSSRNTSSINTQSNNPSSSAATVTTSSSSQPPSTTQQTSGSSTGSTGTGYSGISASDLAPSNSVSDEPQTASSSDTIPAA